MSKYFFCEDVVDYAEGLKYVNRDIVPGKIKTIWRSNIISTFYEIKWRNWVFTDEATKPAFGRNNVSNTCLK